MKPRKKYQRKLNKLIKTVNKNIANDNLWLGRFELRQKYSKFVPFEDGSGAILYAHIRIYDKKTGYFKDMILDYAPWLSFNECKIFEFVNNFIVTDSKVWEETPSPREKDFIKDYTHIRIPEEVMEKDFNFYFDIDAWRKYF